MTSAHSTTAPTTADGNGDWFVRVEFPSAPANERFDVSVDDRNDTAVFDFVRTV